MLDSCENSKNFTHGIQNESQNHHLDLLQLNLVFKLYLHLNIGFDNETPRS